MKLYVPVEVRNRVRCEHHDATLHTSTNQGSKIQSVASANNSTGQRWIEKHEPILDVAMCLVQTTRRSNQPCASQRSRQLRRPFEVVACYLLGSYSTTSNRNRHVFVVIDLFTRWIKAFGFPQAIAIACSEKIAEGIFPRLPPSNHLR